MAPNSPTVRRPDFLHLIEQQYDTVIERINTYAFPQLVMGRAINFFHLLKSESH